MFLLDSTIDGRDYQYKDCITGVIASTPLPDKYESNYTCIENQGTSSHCISHIFTSGLEIKQMLVTNTHDVPKLSRLFLQSECKAIDNYPNSEGTTMRAALKVLQKLGVCEEALYPWIYNSSVKKNIFPEKTIAIYENAEKYRIANYAKLNNDIALIKRAIYNESCVFLSNRNFGNYMSSYKGHILPPSGPYYGNHATLLIGWDDTHTCTYRGKTYTGFFIRLNSYGDKYYANGKEYVPYDAFTNWAVNGKSWFVEAWTAISTESLKKPAYHRLLQKQAVISPTYTEIILTLGSKTALVNNMKKALDAAPMIKNNITFIPIRFFINNISSASCSWVANKKQVHVTDLNTKKRFIFTLDSTLVKDASGECIYTLASPPFVSSGRTFLPIRAYSELLGAKVDYVAKTKQIIIKI